MLLKEIAHGFSHLLYPNLCEGCGTSLSKNEEILCLSCSLQLPRTGHQGINGNETELRFAGRFPFQHAASFAYFTDEGLLQHLLYGLKYAGKKEIGIYLGKQFAKDLQHADWIKPVDVIIPVPLHAKKEAKRGYNQSKLITDGISEILGVPVENNILLRIRDTESQTKKTRSERLDNMQGAFSLKNATLLKGKHVLLIDDMLTTGATLEACALELLKSGDIELSIATIGIAV